MTLSAQCLFFAVTFAELNETRIYKLYGTLQIFLRAAFILIIMLLAFNEVSSIKYQEYAILRGVYVPKIAKAQMIQVLFRYLVTIFGLYTICIYVLTDDKSGEGSKMD